MSQTVIATYRVCEGSENEFIALLEKHWPTLHKAGLATDDPPTVYHGKERGGGNLFVEIFAWKDADSPRIAHETPEIMAVWEPMGGLCEERDGKPKMEFPHVQPLDLKLATA